MVSLITCTLTAQAKRQANLLAESEREKMRANLLRSVSHDIRTPLTSIVGSTSAVLENPGLSSQEQRELLENAREEAQWLIRVVENLLSITRMGDAQARIAKEPEPAEEVLGTAAQKFRRRFPQVSVTVSAPEELLMVPMDPILIEQVLANLLENAAVHGRAANIALLLEAEARGIPCSCGLPMLAAQARRAAELFTGGSIPDSRLEEALTDLTGQMENVVLIGMPGCGKSTLGRCLARRLGKEFLDLDRLVEERAGKTIPAIFAGEGEDAFRALESQVVREAGSRTGCVLSTGGGVVTRRENFAPLRQNGVIVHVTRPLSLLSTAGRPVSQSMELGELWERRAPLYAAFADVTVDNSGPLEETLDNIEKELTRR